MKSKPRKRYTADFKSMALQLLATGRPVSEIAEELCISASLLYSWQRAPRRASAGGEGAPATAERDATEEMRALRKELTRLRQENDILKKAAVILGTKPQPGSAP
jgi:transposase